MSQPIVSVTLARMKMLQVLRFLRWGKPVERFVRDHTGVTFGYRSHSHATHNLNLFGMGNSARHDEHGVGQGRCSITRTSLCGNERT